MNSEHNLGPKTDDKFPMFIDRIVKSFMFLLNWSWNMKLSGKYEATWSKATILRYASSPKSVATI